MCPFIQFAEDWIGPGVEEATGCSKSHTASSRITAITVMFRKASKLLTLMNEGIDNYAAQ